MNIPKYRRFENHEAIVFAFITDATSGENISGIRWVELRKTPNTDWQVHQEGTYAPEDELHRIIPCIAMDGQGNIGMAYNVTSENSYASIRFTGRYASDPIGTMTVRELEIATGITPLQSGGRFGDYGQMGVDPTDNTTFWFTSEYAGGGDFGTKTKIVAFELSRANLDIAVNEIVLPSSSDSLSTNEMIAAVITNTGLAPIEDYTIELFIDGTNIASVTIDAPLASGADYTHEFSDLDFFDKGAYVIEVKVTHPMDERSNNDVLSATLQSLFQYDVELSASTNPSSCYLEDNVMEVTLENVGSKTLESVDLRVSIDGVPTPLTTWTGTLRSQNSTTIEVLFDLPNEGTFDVGVEALNLNDTFDGNPTNNVSNTIVSNGANATIVELRITIDEYPEETYWELKDDEGNIVATGDGDDVIDNLVVENGLLTDEAVMEVCLNTAKCYTLTMLDFGLDGICCDYGEGSYELFNVSRDEVIFSSDGQFSLDEITNFCFDQSCNIVAEVTIFDASDDLSNTGQIMIEASGSTVDNYLYSIDGGATFQAENIFNNLATGDYEVVVRLQDDESCIYEETVTVMLAVSVDEWAKEGMAIRLSPNPNRGFFNIEIEAPQNKAPLLGFEILDTRGRVIQTRKIGRYNGTYKGQVSLLTQASGVYYIRLMGEHSG
ncbi:MAG: CARDB domain-containing protein, partial [Bacteroidota bacterium]